LFSISKLDKMLKWILTPLRDTRDGYLPSGFSVGDIIARDYSFPPKYGVIVPRSVYERSRKTKIPFRRFVPFINTDGIYDFSFSVRIVDDPQAEINKVKQIYDSRMAELPFKQETDQEITRLVNERDTVIEFIRRHDKT